MAEAHPTVWIETNQTEEAAKSAISLFLNSLNESEQLTESVYAFAASLTFMTEVAGGDVSTLRNPGFMCYRRTFQRDDGSALVLNVGRRHLFGTQRWSTWFKECNASIGGWTRCDYDEWLQRTEAMGGHVENGRVFFPDNVMAAEDF